MKITIVTGPSFPVPPVLGGAMAKAWDAIAREFARRGHSVHVYCRSWPGQPEREVRDGVHFVRSGGFSQSRSIALDLLRDFGWALRLVPQLPDADVLVTNDFWLPALAPRLRQRAGRVFVCAARFPKRQYWLYRRAARVVALSGAVAREIARQEPPLAGKVRVIGLPVDASPAAGLTRDDDSQPLLQYVGRVHPEKGVHLLVAAFERLRAEFPQWALRIVGPTDVAQGGGGDGYVAQLRALSNGAAVRIAGPVFDAAQLAQVYASGELLCYPSVAERGEAFGAVPLESMAAGVPPIVSSLECFADFVHDGENGWVFDHRGTDPVTALANVLRDAMGDAPGRRRRGIRGRAEAEGHSVAAIASRYLEEFAQP